MKYYENLNQYKDTFWHNEHTCTKIPFLVGPGEPLTKAVMFDTAQIFFVEGSYVRQYISSTPKEMFVFFFTQAKFTLR